MATDVQPKPPMPGKVYLGDGAYAEYDGFQIRLSASDGIGDTNEVYLEPLALAAFEEFVVAVKKWARVNR